MVLLAAEPTVQAATTTGSRTGRLVTLSPQQIVLQVDRATTTIPTAEVTALYAVPAPAVTAPRMLVDLSDGSQLAAERFTATAQSATLVRAAGPLELSTRLLAAVRLSALDTNPVEKKPAEQDLANQWAALVREHRADPAAGDRLVIRTQNTLDCLAGVIEAVDAEQVRFVADGETLSVKWSKIAGLLYAPLKSAAITASWCTILTSDGSRLAATKVQLVDNVWSVTLASGTTIREPRDRILAVEFRRASLGQMAIETSEVTPYWAFDPAVTKLAAAYYRPRIDRSWSDAPLKIGRQAFAQGLALAAKSELSYRLEEPFTRLQATIGLEARAGEVIPVRLVVKGDGRNLFDEQLDSLEPRPISLDLTGVRRLTLSVSFAAAGTGNRVILGDARLVK